MASLNQVENINGSEAPEHKEAVGKGVKTVVLQVETSITRLEVVMQLDSSKFHVFNKQQNAVINYENEFIMQWSLAASNHSDEYKMFYN